MLIAQRCVSCKSVYGVAYEKYKELIQVSCPSCGNLNRKQAEILNHNSLTIREASNCVYRSYSNLPNQIGKVRTNQVNQVNVHSVEVNFPNRPTVQNRQVGIEQLRRRVEDSGRCFILGTGPSLNMESLDEIILSGIPVIGVNDSFRSFPQLDALVIGDTDFILSRWHKIVEWANQYKPSLFIMGQNRSKGISKKWVVRNGKHGILIDGNSGNVIEDKSSTIDCQVYYWNRRSNIIDEIRFPVELFFKRTIAFSAINLAYQLGAKEIYLLGVDLNNNRHCSSDYDKVGYQDNQFPHLPEIMSIFEKQNGYYKERGVKLFNTSFNSKLNPTIETVNFNIATSQDNQVYLRRLKDRIVKLGKCFLLGAGDSLNTIPINLLAGWPVIGVNSAFYKYPLMDALMFGDPGFINQYSIHIKEWQDTREEKPILFWHGVSSSNQGHVKVVSWCHAPQGHSIWENRQLGYNQMFAIKRSIITPAINLAYSLGAKEIYLAGVDLNNNKHFWDSDESTAKQIGQPVGSFPGSGQIVEFIQKQRDYLANKGVELKIITKGSALDGVLKYEQIEEAANPRELNKRFFI